MASAHAPSLNFAFLAADEPVLALSAAKAEAFALTEPVYALSCLRHFGEVISRQIGARAGVTAPSRENQYNRIARLRDRGLIDDTQVELFHTLRRDGNDAVHDHSGSQTQALNGLRLARKLAIWYHQLAGHPDFEAGPFIPPTEPVDAAPALAAELARLREAAAAQADRLAIAEADVAAARAEAEAWAALVERVEADAAAADTRVAELEAAAAASPDDVQAFVARAKKTNVELDEAETRLLIDAQLRAAGWEADSTALTYAAGVRPEDGRDLAIAEYPCVEGRADYVLFAGLTPIGVVEAKRWSKDVSASIEQAHRYSALFPLTDAHQLPPLDANGKLQWGAGLHGTYKVPFVFATNGRPYLRQLATKSGIWFRDVRRDTELPRPLDGWPTPDELRDRLARDTAVADAALSADPLDDLPLRDYQRDAIRAVEAAIAAGQRDILLAMATGTGKTRTAQCLVYRLVQSERVRRVLFLVDRNALGEQAHGSFGETLIDGLPLTDHFDVRGPRDKDGGRTIDNDTRLHITTVQAMVRRLDSDDAPSIGEYDCLVVDECHRGYTLDGEMSDGELVWRDERDYISKYRRVLDHFDALRIGLTATPAAHTSEIFGDPVYHYGYRRAVIEGHLVDHEPPYTITTRLSRDGIHFDAHVEAEHYDPETGTTELHTLPDEVDIDLDGFNRRVITPGFNAAVCREFARHFDPTGPAKALVFCVDDKHCDIVVTALRDAFVAEYGELHHNAVLKITGNADQPLERLRHYKNELNPTVAVTVDLLTTGVDIPAIDTLFFLRRVKSRILYEQMLGRATRKCDENGKVAFRIFDPVELYRDMSTVSDMKPVVTRPALSTAALVDEYIAADDTHRPLVLDQLVTRFNARKRHLTDATRETLAAHAGLDPDDLVAHLRQTPADALAAWLEARPRLGALIDALRPAPRRVLVSHEPDEVLAVERGYGKGTRPDDYLEGFAAWLTTHRNDLDALIVVTQRPRDLTRAQLRELKTLLDAEGYSEIALRTAYAETSNQDIAASIIGYIRQQVLGEPLMPYAHRVERAVERVIGRHTFNANQQKWLRRIGKQLTHHTVIDRETLDDDQFRVELGGANRLDTIFDGQLDALLAELKDATWGDVA